MATGVIFAPITADFMEGAIAPSTGGGGKSRREEHGLKVIQWLMEVKPIIAEAA